MCYRVISSSMAQELKSPKGEKLEETSKALFDNRYRFGGIVNDAVLELGLVMSRD